MELDEIWPTVRRIAFDRVRKALFSGVCDERSPASLSERPTPSWVTDGVRRERGHSTVLGLFYGRQAEGWFAGNYGGKGPVL